MGKDPAFLFYPGDWIGGTMGMTFEEKGAYMHLLMMQFNRGHMEGHMIGQEVGQLWDKIKDKFEQDSNGLWFNRRLEEEKQKRKKFTDSRKNNLKGNNQYKKPSKKKPKKVAHMEGHMTAHMENEDINENENKINNSVVLPFASKKFQNAWNLWKQYKQEQHGFKYKSAISEQAKLSELAKMANNSERVALDIITRSMANGWKGLFKLDENGEQTDKSQQIIASFIKGE